MYKVTLLDINGNNCGETTARNINEANKISDRIMERIIDLGLQSKYPNKCKIEEMPSDKYKVIDQIVSLNKNGELIYTTINERIIEDVKYDFRP